MQMLVIVLDRLYSQDLHLALTFTPLLVIRSMPEKRYCLTSFQGIAKTVSVKSPRFPNTDSTRESGGVSMAC